MVGVFPARKQSVQRLDRFSSTVSIEEQAKLLTCLYCHRASIWFVPMRYLNALSLTLCENTVPTGRDGPSASPCVLFVRSQKTGDLVWLKVSRRFFRDRLNGCAGSTPSVPRASIPFQTRLLCEMPPRVAFYSVYGVSHRHFARLFSPSSFSKTENAPTPTTTTINIATSSGRPQ